MPIAPIAYPLRRNSQKRIYEEGASYFITAVTYNRYPYFQIPLFSELFINDLLFAKDLKQFKLHGYTVMPDHVHLLITPSSKANYSEVMHNIKRTFALHANQILFSKPQLSNAGDDIYRRLRKNDPYCSLQWSEYLINLHRRFTKQYGHDHNIPFFKWRKSFRDHIIRSDNDLSNHLEYIFNNALKHSLVRETEKWKWMWIETMAR